MSGFTGAFLIRPFLIRPVVAVALCLPLALVCHPLPTLPSPQRVLSPAGQGIIDRLVAAAVERTHHIVRYDPAYVRIPYRGEMFLPRREFARTK